MYPTHLALTSTNLNKDAPQSKQGNFYGKIQASKYPYSVYLSSDLSSTLLTIASSSAFRKNCSYNRAQAVILLAHSVTLNARESEDRVC